MARNKYNKTCEFCDAKADYIDYKNIKTLVPFTTKYSKIVPKYYSGVCLRHQKMLARAIKRARFMALISFVR
ncbi:30S ribosomal protein S18 [Candidatus Peregrinibacteria bacterium]|nr:30S ribosomal protein S18 [Candidatus Peregrinibacteria bacterium]